MPRNRPSPSSPSASSPSGAGSPELSAGAKALLAAREAQAIRDALSVCILERDHGVPLPESAGEPRKITAQAMCDALRSFDRWDLLAEHLGISDADIPAENRDRPIAGTAVFDPPAYPDRYGRGVDLATVAYCTAILGVAAHLLVTPESIDANIEGLHEHWLRRDPHGKHPVVCIQDHCIRLVREPIQTDTRKRGILPSAVTGVPSMLFLPLGERGDLPGAFGRGRGTGSGGGSGGSSLDKLAAEQAHLPGLVESRSSVVESFPLRVYDRVAPTRHTSRTAPLLLRTLLEILTAVPIELRRYEQTVEIPARTLMAQIWAGRIDHPAHQFAILQSLLRMVRSIEIDVGVDAVDLYQPVGFRTLPKTIDGVFRGYVHAIPGHTSPGGGLFSRALLRQFGVESYRLYRGYLGLVALRNKYQTQKGKIMPPFVPEVHRDPATKAILDLHGKPIRVRAGKQKGRLVTDWTHDLAREFGWTGREVPNPQRRLMPWLDTRDLVSLFSDADYAEASPASQRKLAQRTREVIAEIQARGIVIVEREHPGAPTERAKGRYKLFLTDLARGSDS